MFSITELGAASDHWRAMSAGKASPQNKLNRNPGYMPGLRTPNRRMNTAVDGTENQTVNRPSFIKAPGLINCLWVGQHRQAPLSHATNMSCADKSNVRSNICETRSLLVKPKRAVTQSRELST